MVPRELQDENESNMCVRGVMVHIVERSWDLL